MLRVIEIAYVLVGNRTELFNLLITIRFIYSFDRYLLASHFPGLRGCMTKMILGKQCSERYQLTNSDLEEAKRLVRSELAFVGIAEKWQESVRLFHSLHGGQLHSDEIFVRAKESPP